jgi:hypothetical protein
MLRRIKNMFDKNNSHSIYKYKYADVLILGIKSILFLLILIIIAVTSFKIGNLTVNFIYQDEYDMNIGCPKGYHIHLDKWCHSPVGGFEPPLMCSDNGDPFGCIIITLGIIFIILALFIIIYFIIYGIIQLKNEYGCINCLISGIKIILSILLVLLLLLLLLIIVSFTSLKIGNLYVNFLYKDEFDINTGCAKGYYLGKSGEFCNSVNKTYVNPIMCSYNGDPLGCIFITIIVILLIIFAITALFSLIYGIIELKKSYDNTPEKLIIYQS